MPGDSISRLGYHRRMSTVSDRIREILARKEWSARRLSVESKLTPTHVSQIIRKFDAWKPGDDDPRVETGTLREIARAGGVSASWLITGEGSPEPTQDEPSADPGDHDVGQDADPVLRNLPGYDKLLRSAQTLAPEIPRKLWDYLGTTRPWLTGRLTPGALVDLAKVVWKHTPTEEWDK